MDRGSFLKVLKCPLSCIYKSRGYMKKTQEAIDESKRQCQLGREHHALVLAGFNGQ